MNKQRRSKIAEALELISQATARFLKRGTGKHSASFYYAGKGNLRKSMKNGKFTKNVIKGAFVLLLLITSLTPVY